jgi:drug/metabolite transporter (DMT)-like permease
LTPLVVASLAYQGAIAAFLSEPVSAAFLAAALAVAAGIVLVNLRR